MSAVILSNHPILSNPPANPDFMKRDQLISFFFIALLIFIIYQLFIIFSPFFQSIFWAAILTFTFYPIYDRFRKLMPLPDWIPALLMTFIILLVVIPPVVFLVVNITGQTIELYQVATNYIREGRLQDLIIEIRAFPFIQTLEERFGQFELIRDSVENWILNTTRGLGNFTANQVGALTKSTFFMALNLFAMVFLIFIFLKDGYRIYEFIYTIAPLAEATKKLIFGHINETFAAVIRGQLLTSLVQTILAWTIYSLLGLPVPLLLALATFITSLIPIIGASGIWLPLVIFLVAQQAYTRAIILFLLGALVISVIDNILKPAIIGEKTKLPYFLLFFGMLGGLKLYGLMGIFLAPVILSLFFALIKIYQEEYLKTPAS